MRPPLTPKQQRVYEFIAERIAAGLPPTIREIGKALGIKTTNGVKSHLTALERKGYIKLGHDGRTRNIQLVDAPQPCSDLVAVCKWLNEYENVPQRIRKIIRKTLG